MSGPLLDRIDLHVQIPAVRWSDLSGLQPGVTSAEARTRVEAARRRQQRRCGGTNAALPDRDLDARVDPSAEAMALLGRAADALSLSARSLRRVLRVARTLADLDAASRVEAPHVAEAVGYRDARGG